MGPPRCQETPVSDPPVSDPRATAPGSEPRQTPLAALHRALGGRMVAFAGWSLPVQFAGVMAEHLHTRNSASLFDVSHMGQVRITGEEPAAALERLVPQALTGLREGAQRYAFFTSETGGLLDDLMVTRKPGHLYLVVNAARREHDLAHLRRGLPECSVEDIADRALLALQGPRAEAALARIAPEAAPLGFMETMETETAHGGLWIARSGYTGEDGFEISVP